MPVPRNDAAIDVLSTVLTQGHHDRPAELVDYLGYEIHEPDGWLWHEQQPQPPQRRGAPAVLQQIGPHLGIGHGIERGIGKPLTEAFTRFD